MGRPQIYSDGRVNTAIRLPQDLHARLNQAAAERDLSVNFLVTRAIEDFLGRLLPIEEIRWTRDAPAHQPPNHTRATAVGAI